MASILVKTSGIEIASVTVYVPDPPLAPPQPTQPTQSPDPSSGSSSSSSASSFGGGGTTYTHDYYQGYMETILNAFRTEAGSAGALMMGNGYSGQFYNNSTSTSENYQEGGGGGSTSSSDASSSTSNSQQSSSNSSASGSTGSTGSTGSGLYAPPAPTASSPVETVVGLRPQHADIMQYIVDTIRDESSPSAWELSYMSGALYYTAWILCTAMHGEPILLWAPVRTFDDSEKTCAGIVTPEYLIKKFSGGVLLATNTSLSRSRIESICEEGWGLWLDWYAANKDTNTGIEWLYSATQLKLLSTNDSVNDSNLSFRDAASGMSFPAKFIDDAILTGQSSVIDRSILPADIQALASSYTVIL